MSQNRITVSYLAEQISAALNGVQQVKDSLPGLVSMAPEEKKSLLHMGAKTEVFARQTLRALAQNPQIVPASLDLAGAQGDLAALDQLMPVYEKLVALEVQMADTIAALRHDIMHAALDGYAQLKLQGAAHGLEDMRKELGATFAKTRHREPAPA